MRFDQEKKVTTICFSLAARSITEGWKKRRHDRCRRSAFLLRFFFGISSRDRGDLWIMERDEKEETRFDWKLISEVVWRPLATRKKKKKASVQSSVPSRGSICGISSLFFCWAASYFCCCCFLFCTLDRRRLVFIFAVRYVKCCSVPTRWLATTRLDRVVFHGDRVVFVFFVDFPPGFRGYFRSTSFGGSAVCVCVWRRQILEQILERRLELRLWTMRSSWVTTSACR